MPAGNVTNTSGEGGAAPNLARPGKQRASHLSGIRWGYYDSQYSVRVYPPFGYSKQKVPSLGSTTQKKPLYLLALEEEEPVLYMGPPQIHACPHGGPPDTGLPFH